MVEVGQVVYLKPGTNKGRYDKSICRGKVVKVGRKYYDVVLLLNINGEYTESRAKYKYNISDNTQVTNYCADYYVYFSEQDILDEEEFEDIRMDIRSLFDSSLSLKKVLSIEQLRRIKDIIEEGKK